MIIHYIRDRGNILKDSRLKRIVICAISVLILVILDQLAKKWAVATLKGNDGIELIKGALKFYYLPNGNTGAAFGMLQGHQSLFLVIAIVICVCLFIFIYHMPLDKKFNLLIIMMTLIIAGGIGNMIDRFSLNYVVDFIYFYLINFPIFNVADMYVSVGTTVLILLILFYYKEEDIKLIEDCIKQSFKIKKKKDLENK